MLGEGQKGLQTRLLEQDLRISVTDRAKDRLAEEGFDQPSGARQLRRVITKRVEDQLSEDLPRDKVRWGDAVGVDIDADGRFIFAVAPRHETEQE